MQVSSLIMLLGLRMSLADVADKEKSEEFAEQARRVSVGEESFCQAKWAFQEFGQTWSAGRAFRENKKPRLVPLMPNLLELWALATT